jgi:hypothetical protein
MKNIFIVVTKIGSAKLSQAWNVKFLLLNALSQTWPVQKHTGGSRLKQGNCRTSGTPAGTKQVLAR